MTAIPLALIIIVIWGAGTFYFEPPGWFHGLLTGGLFLLFWGIVRRGNAPPTSEKRRSAPE